jgi:Flp pilus assembly protein TadG
VKPQAGQSLIEFSLVLFVLLLMGLGILAVGQIVSEYVAVRAAASQAALVAGRAPSADVAQREAQRAGQEAVRGSQVQDFQVSLNAGSFQRGAALTATAQGYASLDAFPLISQILGRRIRLTWQAHSLIEPYRSRAPA